MTTIYEVKDAIIEQLSSLTYIESIKLGRLETMTKTLSTHAHIQEVVEYVIKSTSLEECQNILNILTNQISSDTSTIGTIKYSIFTIMETQKFDPILLGKLMACTSLKFDHHDSFKRYLATHIEQSTNVGHLQDIQNIFLGKTFKEMALSKPDQTITSLREKIFKELGDLPFHSSTFGRMKVALNADFQPSYTEPTQLKIFGQVVQSETKMHVLYNVLDILQKTSRTTRTKIHLLLREKELKPITLGRLSTFSADIATRQYKLFELGIYIQQETNEDKLVEMLNIINNA